MFVLEWYLCSAAMDNVTSMDMKITVNDLLAAPFSTRSQADKERIVSEGKPKPSFTMVYQTLDGTARKQNPAEYKRIVFDKLVGQCREVVLSLYDETEWLTASATTRSFYCWPCLLFQSPGMWNHGLGFKSVVTLSKEILEHERTFEHIEAMFHLRTFAKQTLKSGDSQADSLSDPQTLKRVTDVVCSLVVVQRPPCESDNAPSSLDVGKCLKTMVLLRKYDSIDKYHSDNAIDWLEKSPDVVGLMIRAVAKVTRLNIAEEIRSSKYVSLVLSQHSNVKLKAQISSVLRYVKNGKVCERFLGFTHVFSSASVDSIYAHIKSLVSEFDIGTKCIALSIDGAILSTDDMNVLCRKLRSDLPHFIFVPWHSHILDHVLQKSSSTHPKCERFFKTIIALETFFCGNPALCTAFNDFKPGNELVEDIVETGCAGSWSVTPRFLKYVLENRQHFVLFFDFVLANSSKWKSDDIAKALGFRECLQDLTTVFLLHVFSKIFKLTSALSAALRSDIPERSFGKELVLRLVNKLNKMRKKDFHILLSDSVSAVDEEPQNVKADEYSPLFNDIMEQVTGEIEMRYSKLDEFHFCGLFDFEDPGWFEQTEHRLQNLAKFYNTDFGQPHILNEMELLSKHRAFSKTSAYDFHQYLIESKLRHTFKALFDISELILAMPFKDLSPIGEISVANKIGKWSFGPELAPVYGDTSIVFVESDYLQELKQSPTFYAEVLVNFSRLRAQLPE